MGLDTTHDAWHGSYGTFNRWRDEVWSAADQPRGPVEPMFPNGIPVRDDVDVPDGVLWGDWGDIEPTDPLDVLMFHSDCDGVIEPKHATALADRLTGLLPKLEAREVLRGDGFLGDRGMVGRTRLFIAGCRAAAAADERVMFE